MWSFWGHPPLPVLPVTVPCDRVPNDLSTKDEGGRAWGHPQLQGFSQKYCTATDSGEGAVCKQNQCCHPSSQKDPKKGSGAMAQSLPTVHGTWALSRPTLHSSKEKDQERPRDSPFGSRYPRRTCLSVKQIWGVCVVSFSTILGDRPPGASLTHLQHTQVWCSEQPG